MPTRSKTIHKLTSCPICSSSQISDLFSGIDENQAVPGEFGVSKCTSCQVVFTNPRPDEATIGDYYPDFYWGDSELDRSEILANYKEIVAWIEANCPKKGRILDIGAGGGYFLSLFDNFERFGVEYSEQAARQGSKKYGIKVFEGDLLNNLDNLKKNSFDIVTLNGVLEHLYHPSEELNAVHGLLKKNGVAIISVPNFNSAMSQLTKDKWYHLDLPRHLFHFTPKTMRALLEKNGFKLVHTDHKYWAHNKAGYSNSLHNKYKEAPYLVRGGINKSSHLVPRVLQQAHLSDVITFYALKG